MDTDETTAYIGIGSNLGDRRNHCAAAVGALGRVPGVRVTRVSAWRETAPVGPVPQGAFVNGVARVATTLDAPRLLAACLSIERALGRRRGERWGPREIDLDLLLFDDAVIDAPDLTVPHPEMARRRFVLEPLAEIAPDAVHPVTGRTALEMLEALDLGAREREAAS